jgi:hypothetical protein
VARKKDTKALFELLSRQKGSMGLPGWMKPKPASPAESAEEGTPASPADEETSAPPEPPETPAEVAETDLQEEVETEVSVPAAEPAEETEPEDEEPQEAEEELEAVVEEDESADVTSEYKPAEEDVEEAEEESAEESEPEPSPRGGRKLWPWKRSSPAEEPAEPVFRAEGNRRFSMSLLAGMLILGVVLVLLVAAFVLGRITTSRLPSSQADNWSDSPQLRPGGLPDSGVVNDTGRRDRDRFYLLIEVLQGNRDEDRLEGDRIRQFCDSRGVPADMVRVTTGGKERVAVWSLTGYRFKNSQAAADHAKKVDQIGREYYKRYGTYRLLQRPKDDSPPKAQFYPGRVETP